MMVGERPHDPCSPALGATLGSPGARLARALGVTARHCLLVEGIVIDAVRRHLNYSNVMATRCRVHRARRIFLRCHNDHRARRQGWFAHPSGCETQHAGREPDQGVSTSARSARARECRQAQRVDRGPSAAEVSRGNCPRLGCVRGVDSAGARSVQRRRGNLRRNQSPRNARTTPAEPRRAHDRDR